MEAVAADAIQLIEKFRATAQHHADDCGQSPWRGVRARRTMVRICLAESSKIS